jgi:hypothetical protein
VVDVTTDVKTDAPLDASKDVSIDVHGDTGVDAGEDATSDAADDSPDDASDDVIVDATPDVLPPPPDGGVTCGTKLGYGFVSVGDGGGACGTGEDYSCGTDMYQIECDCPSAMCTCQKNGIVTGGMASYAGCPGCGATPAFSTLASMCGIPY